MDDGVAEVTRREEWPGPLEHGSQMFFAEERFQVVAEGEAERARADVNEEERAVLIRAGEIDRRDRSAVEQPESKEPETAAGRRQRPDVDAEKQLRETPLEAPNRLDHGVLFMAPEHVGGIGDPVENDAVLSELFIERSQGQSAGSARRGIEIQRTLALRAGGNFACHIARTYERRNESDNRFVFGSTEVESPPRGASR